MPVNNSRLREISKFIKPGLSIADIGSDHARLPLYLVENELVPWVIATELGDGPYIRMQRAVNASGFRERIFARQGNGLEVLCPGEVAGVVIAGMGGDLITDILARDCAKAESFAYYVLQPMSRSRILRKALAVRGWPIVDETLVIEKGQYYVIIHTRPGGEVYSLNDLEEELGPLVLKGSSPLKTDYLKYYLNKYKKVYGNLAKSNRAQALELQDNIKARIRELEAMIDAGKG